MTLWPLFDTNYVVYVSMLLSDTTVYSMIYASDVIILWLLYHVARRFYSYQYQFTRVQLTARHTSCRRTTCLARDRPRRLG